VQFLDWDDSVLKTELVVFSFDATAPADPERDDYEFIGWDIDFTDVRVNLTVRALYAEVEPIDPLPEPPGEGGEETPDPTPGPIPNPGPGSQPGPGELPHQDIPKDELTPNQVLDIIKADESVPIFTILGFEIPLFGIMDLPVWALMNLFLAICGAFCGLVALINAKRRKKSQPELESRQTRRIALLTTLLAAALGIVLFLLTEDITNLMVVFDVWTIVSALILLVVIISMIATNKSRAASKQPKSAYRPAALPAE
jgi:hypothetical protein